MLLRLLHLLLLLRLLLGRGCVGSGGRRLARLHLLEARQAVDLDLVARRQEGVELEDQVLVVLEELGDARDNNLRRDAVLAELAHDLGEGKG